MRLRRNRRRIAVSEVMASLIMISVTLISGAAAFGFVNGQTGSSAQQIGAGVASNVNYLREKEVIVLVNFDNNTGVSLYVYNNGAETLTINNLLIQGPACLGLLTNCVVGSQVQATITYARSTNTWTVTGAGLTCLTKSAAGLSSIVMSSLSRVSAKLTGCSFVFAASPTLPAVSAPPLTNSFTFTAVGQFGSSATSVVTR